MLMRNESPVLVAEPRMADAMSSHRLLRQMGYLVRVATSPQETLRLMRTEVMARALVAVELTAHTGEPLLSVLRDLPAMRLLMATGPPGRADMEILARRAGADVYLPRPVGIGMLAAALRVSVAPSALAGAS